MKKLFMFLAVAGLATFGASCGGSDDNKGGTVDPPVKEKELSLTGPASAETETPTLYTVKSEGKAVDGAEIYVDGTKTSNPVTFSTEGTFTVQAKKAGYKDSNSVKVTVTKKKVVRNIVLTVDKAAIDISEKMVMHVKYQDDNQYTGEKVEILVNGNSIGSLDNVTGAIELTFNAAGTYSLVAIVNEVESNSVSVTVTSAPAATTGAIIYDGKSSAVNLNQFSIYGLNQAETEAFFVTNIVTSDRKTVLSVGFWLPITLNASGQIASMDFTKVRATDYYYFDAATGDDIDTAVVKADETHDITSFAFTLSPQTMTVKTTFKATTVNGKVLEGSHDGKTTQIAPPSNGQRMIDSAFKSTSLSKTLTLGGFTLSKK